VHSSRRLILLCRSSRSSRRVRLFEPLPHCIVIHILCRSSNGIARHETPTRFARRHFSRHGVSLRRDATLNQWHSTALTTSSPFIRWNRLDDFTNELWEGLVEGKTDIPCGSCKHQWFVFMCFNSLWLVADGGFWQLQREKVDLPRQALFRDALSNE
jgi:hypothetical protein